MTVATSFPLALHLRGAARAQLLRLLYALCAFVSQALHFCFLLSELLQQFFDTREALFLVVPDDAHARPGYAA